jgi:hypothetical protein
MGWDCQWPNHMVSSLIRDWDSQWSSHELGEQVFLLLTLKAAWCVQLHGGTVQCTHSAVKQDPSQGREKSELRVRLSREINKFVNKSYDRHKGPGRFPP